MLLEIVDFTIEGFPQELFLDYYLINRKTNHIYSDKVSILVLQLNQLGKEEDEASMPDLYHWAQLFCADTWEEIIMLADKNKEISECIVTLKELSEDERIQLECEAREKARRDAVAREDYVFDKGVEHGLELGLDRMAQLVALLIKDNKLADLEKASTDPAYRDSLFSEYNL